MYAVIQTGGKQYKVAKGDFLKIEKLDAEVDGKVTFDSVLLINGDAGLKVGTPYIDGATVTAKVKAQGRLKKINIIKFKRRKHHMKKQGHRQYYTEIEVTGISETKAAAKPKAAAKAKPKAAAKPKAEKKVAAKAKPKVAAKPKAAAKAKPKAAAKPKAKKE